LLRSEVVARTPAHRWCSHDRSLPLASPRSTLRAGAPRVASGGGRALEGSDRAKRREAPGRLAVVGGMLESSRGNDYFAHVVE